MSSAALQESITAWIRANHPTAKEHVYTQVSEYMFKLLTEEDKELFKGTDNVIPPRPHPSAYRPFF